MIVKLIKLLVRPTIMRLKRKWILIQVIAKNPTFKFGDGVSINNVKLGRYVYLANNCRARQSSLGDYSYCGEGTRIVNTKIGKFTCVGPNVSVGMGGHQLENNISIHPAFYSTAKQVGVTFVKENSFDERAKPTTIGNDVWIGANVLIPGGVQIGNGAVIATGSVVTKDVPAYHIVGGVPAKVMRMRMKSEYAKQIEDSQWWSKDEPWLRLNADSFRSIEVFLEKIKQGETKC